MKSEETAKNRMLCKNSCQRTSKGINATSKRIEYSADIDRKSMIMLKQIIKIKMELLIIE